MRIAAPLMSSYWPLLSVHRNAIRPARPRRVDVVARIGRFAYRSGSNSGADGAAPTVPASVRRGALLRFVLGRWKRHGRHRLDPDQVIVHRFDARHVLGRNH